MSEGTHTARKKMDSRRATSGKCCNSARPSAYLLPGPGKRRRRTSCHTMETIHKFMWLGSHISKVLGLTHSHNFSFIHRIPYAPQLVSTLCPCMHVKAKVSLESLRLRFSQNTTNISMAARRTQHSHVLSSINPSSLWHFGLFSLSPLPFALIYGFPSLLTDNK